MRLYELYGNKNIELRDYFSNMDNYQLTRYNFDYSQHKELFDDWMKKNHPSLSRESPYSIPDDIMDDFYTWVDRYGTEALSHYGYSGGSFYPIDDKVELIPRQTWLIHYTDHVQSILHNGFYGNQ